MAPQMIPGCRWSYGLIKKIGKSPHDMSIGDFVSIGSGVKWVSIGHTMDWVSTFPFAEFGLSKKAISGHPKIYGPLSIGNDVWIGNDVTFIGHCVIGSGAVIGAGSVVSGAAFVPYSISWGNPCEVTKFRFEMHQIMALLKIEWWKWDDEKIMANIDLMCSDKIDEFIRKHLP